MASNATVPDGIARLVAWYETAIRVLAGVSMLTLVVVMAAQVVMRYGFNASLIWAEELCRYILIWQTFLFVGLAYQKGELVAVEIIPLMLRPGWRLALKSVAAIPIIVFLWLMVANGYDYAGRLQSQTIPALDFISTALGGEELGVSIWWVYISVSVGSALLALHVIGSIVTDALALKNHAQRKPPAAVHGDSAL
jgi:TRAP-type C4-dicarboxylate transport system permease small subunit